MFPMAAANIKYKIVNPILPLSSLLYAISSLVRNEWCNIITGINSGMDNMMDIAPPLRNPMVIDDSITFKIDIIMAQINVHNIISGRYSGDKLKNIVDIGMNSAVGAPKNKKLEIILAVIMCKMLVSLK